MTAKTAEQQHLLSLLDALANGQAAYVIQNFRDTDLYPVECNAVTGLIEPEKN